MLESDPKWHTMCDEYEAAEADVRRCYDAIRYRKTPVETNLTTWPSENDLAKLEAANQVRDEVFQHLRAYLNARGNVLLSGR